MDRAVIGGDEGEERLDLVSGEGEFSGGAEIPLVVVDFKGFFVERC